jgi:uncharacterized protein YjbJ (UPF0337 family)
MSRVWAAAPTRLDSLPTISDGNAANRRHPDHHPHPTQENTMNKDQTAGRIDEVKGKVKEVAGKIVGNKDLEVKGTLQNASGKVQAGYGDLKADIKKSS